MNITIHDIVALNKKGGRERNEDSVFPEENVISADDRLFMVCDGVGGVRGGDRASRLVCRHFSDYMLQLEDVYQSKEVLGEALHHAEQCLDEYIRSHPECAGMATTLAYLSLTGYGAVIAWVGDSRVLQIREGRIIRQTKDHSLVNALLDYGEITREQAAVHPKRNVLLRAVSGAGEPARLDTLYVDDIMPGDYFMLCSDGVIEGVGDRMERLFAESFSLEQLKNDIDELCRQHTADNYSLILLRIGDVNSPPTAIDDLEWTVPGLKEEAPRSARVDGPEGSDDPPTRRARFWLLLLTLVVAFLAGWQVLRTIPLALQVVLVGEQGVLIRDEAHAVLIDAFPLSDKVREHQAFGPVRRAMLEGKRPFDQVEWFLVSHRPNVEADSVESFLRRYLERNTQVELYPEILLDQLEAGRALFGPAGQSGGGLSWRGGELDGASVGFVRRLPSAPADTIAAGQSISAFLLRMYNDKTLLYAGDPHADVDFLSGLEEDIDYLLINEWNLRQGAARRALSSRFTDDQIIILPSGRPMNNRQREEIRLFFPGARFLKDGRARLKL